MPIVKVDDWEKCVRNNDDPYGGCCVNVAREVMRMLDADPTPITDTTKLICDASAAMKSGGITGFMAGAVASMVSNVHSRGEEFREVWNKCMGVGDEADQANAKEGAVINPSILEIDTNH